MKRLFFGAVWALCSLYGLLAANMPAPLTVARVFGSYMVLQHGIRIPVWGTAAPGATVSVAIGGQEKSGVADADGRWQVSLDSLPLGKALEMKVVAGETITFSDILVGDVWLCGGQSNMEMPVAGWGSVLNFQEEVAAANYPNIRLMTVKRAWGKTPIADIQTDGWQPCSPASVGGFSAVGYFFGREIHAKTGLPIGLISCNWGGTPAEAWTSEAGLRDFPEFAERIRLLNATNNPDSMLLANYQRELDTWSATMVKKHSADDARWHEPAFGTSDWKTMALPKLWEEAGMPGVDGVVWFRKKIELPATWTGKDISLHLGAIDDIDQTWVNGVKTGSMVHYDAPRIYTVPTQALGAGNRLVVAVKVVDTGGGGGFWGSPDSLYVSCEGQRISLSGDWSWKLAFAATPATSPPESQHVHCSPSVLYNGMLRPLMPYGLKGVIWYQGESNVPHAHQYASLFPAMIRTWRNDWGQGDFPFIFTQLANYTNPVTTPAEDAWAELREAQTLTLQAVPGTGMAVAIDIGDAADIHPKNKQDVGRRLAFVAERDVYHLDVPAVGPVFRDMKVAEGQIRLWFDHAQGLTAKGDTGKGFAVAGKDRKFYWATARIEGVEVVLTCPQVPHPVAVRYAWAANPVCNLYNAAGLPMQPFRTDGWKGITKN